MTEATLKQFAKDLKKHLSGYIAVTVTDVNTGISFFTNTRRPTFNPEIASAYNLEVVKAKLKAIEALNLNETIDYILINLKK